MECTRASSSREYGAEGRSGEQYAKGNTFPKWTSNARGKDDRGTVSPKKHRSSGILARASAERRGRHAAGAAGGTNKAVENERTRNGTARKTYQALQPMTNHAQILFTWKAGAGARTGAQRASARRGLACGQAQACNDTTSTPKRGRKPCPDSIRVSRNPF